MSDPRTDCGPYIKLISDALSAEANRNLKKHNLTLSQTHVLMFLYQLRSDHCAALKELEGHFQVSQPTMAGLTARLQEKGLIHSFTDAHDRRVKRVGLTQAGLAVCHTSHQEILATEQRLTSALTPEEREMFLDMLRRIYQTLR